MKTLNKIRLINWQGFYDNTIEVDGNILVTGENGSGKSSMLDAIYFLLSGGSNKFNLAATDETSRSVETYMRGTIGAEGRECLRPSPSLLSHVALLFRESDGSTFILGVALEIRDGAPKADQSYYAIRGGDLDDALFYQDGKIKNGKALFDAAKSLFGDESLTVIKGTKGEIRSHISRLMGLNGAKYYELLPKAIAFKPIKEVNEFVFNFLLPENNVDIASIRESIQSYLAIRADVEKDEEKKTQLESLMISNGEYEDKILQISLLETLAISKNKESVSSKIGALEAKVKAETSLALEAEQEKDRSSAELSSISIELMALSGDDSYRAREETNRALEEAKRKVSSILPRVSSYNRMILEEAALAKDLALKGDFAPYVKSEDFPSFLEALTQYDIHFEARKNALNEEMGRRFAESMAASKEAERLEARLDSLRRGAPVYDRNVVTLMELIRHKSEEEFGYPIDVYPFCELIEIEEGEEEWRNAVEGYLNTRRFDLFVDERYYDFALSVYERNKMAYHIDSVGLVNLAKLNERPILPSSLATKVRSSHEGAKKYISYLLGDIICVSNEQELKLYESSITKTVMVYRNKAARQTRESAYRTPYIGKGAYSAQLKECEEAYMEASRIAKEKAQDVSDLRLKLNRVASSNRKILLTHPNVWAEFSSAKQEEKRLSETLSKLMAKGGSHASWEELSAKQKELEARRDQALEKAARLRADIDMCEGQIKTLRDELALVEADFAKKMSNPRISSKFETFAKKTKMSAAEIQREVGSLSNEVHSLERIIVSGMATYISTFQFDSAPGIANMGDFVSEYQKVVKRELSQFKADLAKAERDCAKAFQENYIAKIRKNIIDQKANIKKLNKVLSDKPFGNDGEIYQFVLSKSKDPSFAPYYDIFCSKEEVSSRDLFLDSLGEKDAELMRDLFARLTSSPGDERQEKILKAYTDYRNFMSYDIEISNRHGEISFFSKIQKGKSGGETQTPFYVIIAASFDQIVQEGGNGKSSGCLVILDEAFNKMDASRIASTMSYFKELSIQLLIGLPSNNAKILMPYVDTTIGLVKSRDRIYVRTDRLLK